MALYYTPIPYNFLNDMGKLSDAEYGRLIRWCQNYSITGEAPELKGNEKFYTDMCRREIDRIVDTQKEVINKKAMAGRKGAEKRWHTMADNGSVMADDGKNSNINTNTNTNTKKNIIEDTKVSLSDKSDFQTVINAWNDMAAKTGLPKIVRLMADTERGKSLKKRLLDYGLDNVLTAIKNVETSAFLTGNNKKGWQADFGWVIRPNNFIKVLEGNYNDRINSRTAGTTFEELARRYEEEGL